MINDKASGTNEVAEYQNTWSARRVSMKVNEKRLMAEFFSNHDFLVRDEMNPELDQRETVAAILVNQGTTPNTVVEESLHWVEKNQKRGPFDITWYTPGHLIPTTLRLFREAHPYLLSATQLFLFPGKVDHQFEAVSGPDAVDFAERLMRRFTYAILGAYSFDINSGTVYFHMPEEVRLQKACATRYAAHKFLFLDSSKFKSEGEIGYSIHELLSQSESATIYTVSSDKDEWIKEKFWNLCDKLIMKHNKLTMESNIKTLDMKALRLRIVGVGESPTDSSERKGLLIESNEIRHLP